MYGFGYGFTVLGLISSFLAVPLFFLLRRSPKVRMRLLAFQIILFVYWNIICWVPELFEHSLYPSTSGPGGSLVHLYLAVTPVWMAFIIVELVIVSRTAKRNKQASKESGLLHLD